MVELLRQPQGSMFSGFSLWRAGGAFRRRSRFIVRTDSRPQQLRNRRTNLDRKNLTALAIEVDVVAVEFGMSAHRCIEIDCWNLLGSHYFRCSGVASRNPFIRVFRLRVISDVFAIAQRSCGRPNQLGL